MKKSPYDASVGGLAALARHEHAKMLRRGAQQMRARASRYTTEHEWVRESYETAKAMEDEANALEYDSSRNNSYRPRDFRKYKLGYK